MKCEACLKPADRLYSIASGQRVCRNCYLEIVGVEMPGPRNVWTTAAIVLLVAVVIGTVLAVIFVEHDDDQSEVSVASVSKGPYWPKARFEERWGSEGGWRWAKFSPSREGNPQIRVATNDQGVDYYLYGPDEDVEQVLVTVIWNENTSQTAINRRIDQVAEILAEITEMRLFSIRDWIYESVRADAKLIMAKEVPPQRVCNGSLAKITHTSLVTGAFGWLSTFTVEKKLVDRPDDGR